MRLEALEKNKWPIVLAVDAMRVSKPKASIDPSVMPFFFLPADRNPFKASMTAPFARLNTQDKVIKCEGSEELVPIAHLITEGLEQLNRDPRSLGLPCGNHRLKILFRPKGASFCFDGHQVPIEAMEITYSVEVATAFFPFEFSSYTQQGHTPTLAWLARAAGTIDGEEAEVRFVIRPSGDGNYVMSCPQFLGIKEGGYLLWSQLKDATEVPPGTNAP